MGALFSHRAVLQSNAEPRSRTIKSGLTEAEAQAHCARPDTKQRGVYFDGYDYMKGCRP
jgi:hypothetical protein